MRRLSRTTRIAGTLAFLFAFQESAFAYIGPGAGFAFLGSFLIILATFFLAFATILAYPFRLLIRLLVHRKSKTKSHVDRVVIVGLDGMDPRLARRFMDEGLMPHFTKLAQQGRFSPLATAHPSMSPSAWSSFTTGVDSSKHNIFDFITRDPCTYLPQLSSADIRQAKKVLPLGKYRIPLEKPSIRLLRKSKPFWKILGEHKIFSTIQRVPITFPPEKFNGVLLSAMCVPDLRGSQGEFTYYSSKLSGDQPDVGGVQVQVQVQGDKVETHLDGPDNSMVANGGKMKLPMTITIDRANNEALLEIDGQKVPLKPRTYTPWVSFRFKAMPGVKVNGIARFYVNSLAPDFEMYVTPIQIDPEKPALPISHPFIYAIYLAKKHGPYATLGLAEDTWALNERVIDEPAFLEQAYLIQEEREKMLFDALETTKKGLITTVFDTTDRIQHMFFRYLDPDHPANAGKDIEKYKNTIADLYANMDKMLARIQEKIGPRDLLIVMSDHGFSQFQRGVNLNSWLRDEGYLYLKDESRRTSDDWFENVDWSRTKAFALGLTGMFINRKGREAQGIVAEGEELETLKAELVEKLSNMKDSGREGASVMRRVFDTVKHMPGPYASNAPDLLIGYQEGYRHSWECATGQVTDEVISDNTKSWSGDHCIDPDLVPGVIFSSQGFQSENPHIMDLAPTALSLFGVDVPKYMQGKRLFEGSPFSPPSKPAPTKPAATPQKVEVS